MLAFVEFTRGVGIEHSSSKQIRCAILFQLDVNQVVTNDTWGHFSLQFHRKCLIRLTSTTSGASVGWCCTIDTQLFQVVLHSLGDTPDRF